MNSVSFEVRFINPKTEEEDIIRHDITVYESIHAPAFRNRCRQEIISFMNRTYYKGLGYTHFISRFVTPLGVHHFKEKETNKTCYHYKERTKKKNSLVSTKRK